MSDYRIETVWADEDTAVYFVHEITDDTTEAIVSCDSQEKAFRVLEGLSWVKAWDSGRIALPEKKKEKPMRIIFTPAKKVKK